MLLQERVSVTIQSKEPSTILELTQDYLNVFFAAHPEVSKKKNVFLNNLLDNPLSRNPLDFTVKFPLVKIPRHLSEK